MTLQLTWKTNFVAGDNFDYVSGVDEIFSNTRDYCSLSTTHTRREHVNIRRNFDICTFYAQ